MNKTIEKQLNHRTIRKFKDIKIDNATYTTLLEVANRTPTSMGMQSYSIIRITKPTLKEEISKVCKQNYVKDAPELLIFIVDLYRNAKISEEMGKNLESKKDMDRFFQGFTDAVLAAQNMYTAIESLGMGANYYGSILNDPKKMIEILQLPPLTFPVLGLGFGYPNQEPMLKPRMDLSLKVFENQYKIQDDYLESIKQYDETIQSYYDLRDDGRAANSFSKQVVKLLENPMEKRSKILNIIKDQGFDFQLD